jgi:hypothetical protein
VSNHSETTTDNETNRTEAQGLDVLSAVLRGPESVFVYWSLEGERSASIVDRLGPDIQWVLRVLDIQNGTSERFSVEREAGNYYVGVRPGGTYGFELAAVAGDTWRTVARTGQVRVPAALASNGTGRSPRPDATSPGTEGAARRGLDVPGLHAESTPLNTGSSEFAAAANED